MNRLVEDMHCTVSELNMLLGVFMSTFAANVHQGKSKHHFFLAMWT